MSKASLHFPGLNPLRFFAAFAVIITHIELLKGAFRVPNLYKVPIFQELGSLGVSFFFVLSGFLITYLLLIEKERTGTVAIRSFYMRRILRIWPLYYLIFILGFFVLPFFDSLDIRYLEESFHENYVGQFITNLLILPNLGLAIYDSFVPHIGQAWSIGVEEQFYLVWPVIIYYTRNYLRVLFILLLALIALKVSILFLSQVNPSEGLMIAKRFLAALKIENMIIGGVGAYLLYSKKLEAGSILFNKWIEIGALAMIPTLVYVVPPFIQDGIHLVNSGLFLIIIMNASHNPNSVLRMSSSALDYLGRISYGIYMYHMMLIPIVVVSMKLLIPDKTSILLQVSIYLIAPILTIAISAASYEYFEKPFLKLKQRFGSISRD